MSRLEETAKLIASELLDYRRDGKGFRDSRVGGTMWIGPVRDFGVDRWRRCDVVWQRQLRRCLLELTSVICWLRELIGARELIRKCDLSTWRALWTQELICSCVLSCTLDTRDLFVLIWTPVRHILVVASWAVDLRELLELCSRAENPMSSLSRNSQLSRLNNRIQYTAICLWKFGHQFPTSPLLPPRKVTLEDLIYTSCTDPIPQPAAARTPRLHQPSAVTHVFYAYVRKATDTDFNVFVLGRDLILVCDSLANQFRTSLKICE
ncbi:hypothetical protein F511_39234 [Dorcoceras hygrometricum]|uniref:Uncharacterized protein n=1 Tax=Dorcoceras hygrometricum TaxID=472368 RepID=A0A2Z7CM47_9LAMI|nr:hypothetical protein F511_39234 [Dorcoceras hygrometricum]